MLQVLVSGEAPLEQQLGLLVAAEQASALVVDDIAPRVEAHVLQRVAGAVGHRHYASLIVAHHVVQPPVVARGRRAVAQPHQRRRSHVTVLIISVHHLFFCVFDLF